MTNKGVLTYEQVLAFPRTHLYMVFAETAKGAWVNVHRGNNYDSAVATANFWDERVNVEFIDVIREKTIEAAEVERERERRASLPISEQLEISLADQLRKIDADTEEVLRKY